MQTLRIILPALALFAVTSLIWPSPAFANAGFYGFLAISPMLWWIMVLPLTFEWWVTTRWVARRAGTALFAVLSANALSTFVGFFLMYPLGTILDELFVWGDKGNTWLEFVWLGFLFFALPIASTIIEYPVFREFAEMKTGDGYWKLWKIVLGMNFISHMLTIGSWTILVFIFAD